MKATIEVLGDKQIMDAFEATFDRYDLTLEMTNAVHANDKLPKPIKGTFLKSFDTVYFVF